MEEQGLKLSEKALQDFELVKTALRGDEKAFARLLARSYWIELNAASATIASSGEGSVGPVGSIKGVVRVQEQESILLREG